MEYKKLGDSELSLSVITFGAWAAGGWMWGGSNRKDAVNAIKSGFEVGITSIDTAPIYGQGTSEEIVGEAIKEFSRDKVQILTKFGMRWDLPKGDFVAHSKDNSGNEIDIYKYAGKKSIIYECEQSLKRLGTDYIDLYQMHWPETVTPIQETFEAVSTLIEQGKIRYAAVCNYSAAQMKEAEKYCNIVSNQLPYSMMNRKIEAEAIPYCIKNNKSILAYSPMERGLLTGKIKPDHIFAAGDGRSNMKIYRPENIQKVNEFLNRIKPIAEEHGATLAQLVLNWTIKQPGITIALAGARNAEQALQNAKAAEITLTQEDIDFINKEIAKL
ncbi:aldo/keto reductase [Apibacter adventoris]|uniref:Aldo/keto reductase n=1 Tax=Apibacter adventoris TaxID=1679466 RepID=A0A2S8ADU3_9FLAO|nr:aldo/keto reductase [Apibacter adventoris]PQL93060.1 aldo/keto reductase [Apibacter adventoris]